MQTSPNTVKTFLRLVMIKMGVSTQSRNKGLLLESWSGNHGVRANPSPTLPRFASSNYR